VDTIARAQIGIGRYADAEATLNALAAPFDHADGEAEHILTLAETQRRQGHTDEAQRNLDESLRMCADRGLADVRLRVLQEQAEVYAAQGRHREAFETYKLFHADAEALHSQQREAQARTRQAMFETNEARQEARRFREQALRDPLTRLRNRRFVDEQLPVLLDDAARSGRPVAVGLVDLDHFKRINDTLSHDAGDRVLIAVAALLAAAVEGGAGFAARMGGEEFLLVLPDTSVGEATRRMDELRVSIRGQNWRPVTGDLPVTVSIGVCGTAVPTTQLELLTEVDRYLYEAKRGGRDRVVAKSRTAVRVPDGVRHRGRRSNRDRRLPS
jgi:diguanylate cyclase (GGDEF)-like protein